MSRDDLNGINTVHDAVVRGAVEIAPNIVMCDIQQGQSGRGKVWTPSLIRPLSNDPTRWTTMADVKPSRLSYRKNQWRARLFGYADVDNMSRYCECYMPDELRAVQFMIRNAPEFLK
jgi:hypothetical protein